MKKGQEYNGTVEKIRFPNKGIVRVCTEDGKEEVCIVKNVLPHQKIRFRVTKKRNGNCEGTLLEVTERSPYETDSSCPHFEACGGCSYQTLPYDRQLQIKEEQVHALIDPVITDLVDINQVYERILQIGRAHV